MSNADEKLTPKNYIKSGISRNLLTPCRRVGLSRTKKTPDNTPRVSCSPRTSSTSLAVRGRQNITDSIDSENTPKRCFTLQSGKYSEVTPDKNIIENNFQPTDNCTNAIKTPSQEKFPNCRRLGLSRKKTTPKDISNLQNQIVSNVKGDASIITKNAKRCLEPRLDEANPKTYSINIDKDLQISLECWQNTNILKPSVGRNPDIVENRVTSALLEDELPYRLSPDLDLSTNTLTSNCPVNIEADTPPISPVFSKVSVLVHHPTAEKYINSIVTDKLDDQPRDVIEGDKSQNLPEILEDSELIVKSKKLKLDGVDVKTKETNTTKTVKNMSFNTSDEATKLTRFTTEDYLEEYSKNPQIFEDSSGTGDTKNTLTHIDGSDSDDFQPLEIIRTKKNSNKNCTEKRESKNYMAILCPLSENVTCESTKGLSESLVNHPLVKNPQKNLTVSLEPLSDKNIKDKISDSDKNNSLFSQGKSIASKLTSHTDDSDDEMFTSSPESNRKQRDNLMQLISTMKKEIKEKEETLERLKQAHSYKRMHNIEELNRLTNRWIQGCKIGLEDLLIKLLKHGPMEMDILIKKLMIPDDIVNKLKLL